MARIAYTTSHAGIGGRCDVNFPGWDAYVWRGCLVGGGAVTGAWDYLVVQSTKSRLILLLAKPHYKDINTIL